MSDAAGTPPDGPSGPSLADSLGLGMLWQPIGVSWDWGRIDGLPQGTLHVLRFQTPLGLIGVGFADKGLEAFVRQAEEHLGGLVVAKPADLHVLNGGRGGS